MYMVNRNYIKWKRFSTLYKAKKGYPEASITRPKGYPFATLFVDVF